MGGVGAEDGCVFCAEAGEEMRVGVEEVQRVC